MIPSRPRVSVGVPVRNGERFLPEALDSLLAQSYKNFELIISDNASSDRTQSICREYAARDHRIRYYRSEQDVGLANNFNYLFIRARGEYFKWAAADDVHEPDWISNCLTVLEQDPSVVLVYGKTRFIDENGALVNETDPGFDLRFDAAIDRLRYVISATSWVNAIFGLIRSYELAKTRLLPELSRRRLPPARPTCGFGQVCGSSGHTVPPAIASWSLQSEYREFGVYGPPLDRRRTQELAGLEPEQGRLQDDCELRAERRGKAVIRDVPPTRHDKGSTTPLGRAATWPLCPGLGENQDHTATSSSHLPLRPGVRLSVTVPAANLSYLPVLLLAGNRSPGSNVTTGGG